MPRTLVVALAAAALVLSVLGSSPHADVNGEPLKERRCFKPALLFPDGETIRQQAEVGAPCDAECGTDGHPDCDNPSLCPPDFTCGDCAFLDELVELVVRGVNELCDAPEGEKCIDVRSSCQTIEQELFAGTTFDLDGEDWTCGVGGRGAIMGEAALCMLRDLANPALAIDPGGPLVGHAGTDVRTGTDVRAVINLGDPFGTSEIRQRLKFQSFDREQRTMTGYQDIKLCLPVLGCIDHEVQKFTARLVQSDAAPATCGDVALDQAHALVITAEDNEHELEFNFPDINVPTPIGPLTFEPVARFRTFLKDVLSPYQGETTHFRTHHTDEPGCTEQCRVPEGAPVPIGSGYAAELMDVYGRSPGVAETIAGATRTGWSSQYGLGGRNADSGVDRLEPSDDPLWNPTTDRPDLVLGNDPRGTECTQCFAEPRPDGCGRDGDSTPARSATENEPAGDAYAALNVEYDFREQVNDVLALTPFAEILRLKQAKVTVRPEVGTSFASQWNVFFSEGIYAPNPEFGCVNRPSRSVAEVRMPNGAAARAFFDIFVGLDFKLRIRIPVFGGEHTIINLHPRTQLLKEEKTAFARGPQPFAISEIALPTPAPTPDRDPTYGAGSFSFSGAPIDAAFIAACLDPTAPQPTEVPIPAPTYSPGDPRVLADAAKFPCNVCLPVGGRYLGCAFVDPAARENPAQPDDCVVRAGCTLLDGADGDCAANGDACIHLGGDGAPDGRDELCRPRGACDPAVPPQGPGDVCECVHVDADGVADGDDGKCERQLIDTREHADPSFGLVNLTQFDTPMRPGQEWRCDDPSKLGCFDLCTYDPTAAGPLTVAEDGSALEREPRCGRAPTVQACAVDADCDDGNPCTDDVCSGAGDVGCVHNANTAPCDDGLHCTGTDQCANGRCEVHAGNPCFGNGPEANACDEASAACRSADGSESCGNGIDDNGDGAIDCADPLCPAVSDPETGCQCLPIGRDPGVIRFHRAGAGRDYLNVHGTVAPCTAVDPTTEQVGVVLSNANGVIYDATLPLGAMQRRGRHRFVFRDPVARRQRSGIYRVDLVYRPSRGVYQVRVQAYGDLTAATEALMTLQLRFGSDTFMNTSAWRQTGKGWVLALPGE